MLEAPATTTIRRRGPLFIGIYSREREREEEGVGINEIIIIYRLAKFVCSKLMSTSKQVKTTKMSQHLPSDRVRERARERTRLITFM